MDEVQGHARLKNSGGAAIRSHNIVIGTDARTDVAPKLLGLPCNAQHALGFRRALSQGKLVHNVADFPKPLFNAVTKSLSRRCIHAGNGFEARDAMRRLSGKPAIFLQADQYARRHVTLPNNHFRHDGITR